MLVSDFDYDLPPECIAQEPWVDRAGSRLLQLNRSGSWQDRCFREFPELLRPGDLLVLNNTRVFPARLYGHRSGQRAQPVSPHNPAARDFLRGAAALEAVPRERPAVILMDLSMPRMNGMDALPELKRRRGSPVDRPGSARYRRVTFA